MNSTTKKFQKSCWIPNHLFENCSIGLVKVLFHTIIPISLGVVHHSHSSIWLPGFCVYNQRWVSRGVLEQQTTIYSASIWTNYSDLSQGHLKSWIVVSSKTRNYRNLARSILFHGVFVSTLLCREFPPKKHETNGHFIALAGNWQPHIQIFHDSEIFGVYINIL